jgi:hypothetical protein
VWSIERCATVQKCGLTGQKTGCTEQKTNFTGQKLGLTEQKRKKGYPHLADIPS